MLTGNQLKSYKEQGYLLLKNFLQKEEVQQVLDDAKNVFFRQFLNKGYLENASLSDTSDATFNNCLYRLFEEDIETLSNCGKQAQHLISLHALSLNEKIQKLLGAIQMGFPVISTRPVMFFNHPKLAKEKVFYKVDAHQDWRSMQGSLNSAVIWIPLIDIDKSLGALEILPGSHLKGLTTDHIEKGFGMVSLDGIAPEDFLSVEVEVGDILLFSSFLVHQSGENVSDSPRWSCHFRYNDLDESSFIARKFAHAYIYKPIDDLITPDFPSKEEIAKVFQ